jgi:hypothetical protein
MRAPPAPIEWPSTVAPLLGTLGRDWHLIDLVKGVLQRNGIIISTR